MLNIEKAARQPLFLFEITYPDVNPVRRFFANPYQHSYKQHLLTRRYYEYKIFILFIYQNGSTREIGDIKPSPSKNPTIKPCELITAIQS